MEVSKYQKWARAWATTIEALRISRKAYIVIVSLALKHHCDIKPSSKTLVIQSFNP